MVAIKLNGANTVYRNGTASSSGGGGGGSGNSNNGFLFWNASQHRTASAVVVSTATASSSSSSRSSSSGISHPMTTTTIQQQHQYKYNKQRWFVSILLGTFVFITMFLPIVRFVQYDDSHLLLQQHYSAMVLLNNDNQQNDPAMSTAKTTTNTNTAVTLMDVAFGKAPLSDYIQATSSQTTATTTTTPTTTGTQRDHTDPLPSSKQKQQQPPFLRSGIAVEDTSDMTTEDEGEEFLPEEDGEVNVDTEETDGDEGDESEEEEEAVLVGIDTTGGTADETETDKEGIEIEEDEEHVIQPTVRTIPPFVSWEHEVQLANQYIQSFTHVGRTSPILPSNSNNIPKKKKKKKRKKLKHSDTTTVDDPPPPSDDSYTDALLFVHIPKTAGTAIESAAGTNPERPLAWGSCRFHHTPKRDICHYPPQSELWPPYFGWWHLPAQLFPIANRNPYENAELFGVIRDPYDRMVSEFYYICTLKVFPWRPNQCDRNRLSDVSYMNEWLSTKIRNREMDSGRSYLIDNGHFTPQYDYIFGPNQVRMLDYVLLMDSERFNDDFHTLMNAYDLPNVQLKKLNALGATARTDTHLDTTHLDTNTIQWIHNMYPDDFALGGYQKKSN